MLVVHTVGLKSTGEYLNHISSQIVAGDDWITSFIYLYIAVPKSDYPRGTLKIYQCLDRVACCFGVDFEVCLPGLALHEFRVPKDFARRP